MKYLFLIFSFPLLLFSCEIELSKENYVEVSKPENSSPINISLPAPNDTMKIFTSSNLNYIFNTYGKKVLFIEFIIENKRWQFTSDQGVISINPSDFTPGLHTLTANIYTHTGTGSIADIANSESYYSNKEWKVLIDGREPPILDISCTITDEGFLKLNWEKCLHYDFKRYEIYSIINSRYISIYNVDSTSYVDKTYVGGQNSYILKVFTNVSENYYNGNKYPSKVYTINEPFPTIKFEERKDSIKVYWNKSKFRCTYSLGIDTSYRPIYISKTYDDTTYIMPHPGLSRAVFDVKVIPLNEKESYDILYHGTDYSLLNGIDRGFGFNVFDKVIYARVIDKYNSKVKCFSYDDMSEIDSITSAADKFSCPTNSGKIAFNTNNTINIYNDKHFSNPTIIENNNIYNMRFMFFTNNDMLITVSYPSKELIQYFDVNTKSIICTLEFPVDIDKIAVSRDGRYLCVLAGNHGLYMYEKNQDKLQMLYNEKTTYNSAVFSETDYSKIYTTKYNLSGIEVRNANNFSLDKNLSFSISNTSLYNFDLITGNLLIGENFKQGSSTYYYYVYDINTENIILKIKNNREDAYIMNNKIYTSSNHMLDISKLINK